MSSVAKVSYLFTTTTTTTSLLTTLTAYRTASYHVCVLHVSPSAPCTRSTSDAPFIFASAAIIIRMSNQVGYRDCTPIVVHADHRSFMWVLVPNEFLQLFLLLYGAVL